MFGEVTYASYQIENLAYKLSIQAPDNCSVVDLGCTGLSIDEYISGAEANGIRIGILLKEQYSGLSQRQILETMYRRELDVNVQNIIDIYNDARIPNDCREKFFKVLFDQFNWVF